MSISNSRMIAARVAGLGIYREPGMIPLSKLNYEIVRDYLIPRSLLGLIDGVGDAHRELAGRVDLHTRLGVHENEDRTELSYAGLKYVRAAGSLSQGDVAAKANYLRLLDEVLGAVDGDRVDEVHVERHSSSPSAGESGDHSVGERPVAGAELDRSGDRSRPARGGAA